MHLHYNLHWLLMLICSALYLFCLPVGFIINFDAILNIHFISRHYIMAMRDIGLHECSVGSVRVFVRLIDCLKTANHIIKLFSFVRWR